MGFLTLMLVLPGSRAADEGPSEKVKKHLGDQLVKLLQAPTKVETYRIEPAGPVKANEAQIGGYRIKSTGKEQKEEFAKKLAVVLLDEKTLFGESKRCFLPGVAFRMWKGEESVDVIICFNCSNLRMIARDAKGKVIKEAIGAFGPQSAALVKLAREAFPDDKDLEKLEEKK
jgi:hypothetical protein